MLKLSTLFLSICCLASTAQAAVIFGDSFSDQYCFYDATSDEFPSFPYYEGRFSNGPIWTDYAFEGTQQSYACAGATSSRNNIYEWNLTSLYNTGLIGQVEAYLYTSPVDIAAQTFYISLNLDEVWSIIANPSLSLVEKDELFKTMINNIELATIWLQEAGAAHITLINVPDFAVFPFVPNNLPAILVHRYNKLLARFALENQFNYFDLNEKFLFPVLQNPAKYGFVEVKNACLGGWMESQICTNPNEYLFWDNMHFSSRAHELIAEAILNP